MSADHDTGYLVARTARGFARVAEARLRTIGLSVAHTPVLVTLAEAGPLSQTEIAQRIRVEQPTAAALLQRMAKAGLIQRSPDPRDRRASRISLTTQAHAVLPQALELRAATESAATAELSAHEIALLHDLLRRVMTNLDAIIDKDGPASSAASSRPEQGPG